MDTAPDGYTGIAVARARPPAVAIVDIGLPGMNGWDVARALRREFGAGIRLIAYTSWGRSQDHVRSTEAGFDAHLVKPAVDELLGTITALLPRA